MHLTGGGINVRLILASWCRAVHPPASELITFCAPFPYRQVRVTPDRVLEIEGERRDEREEDDPDGRVHRVERVFGVFRRRFQLPDNVDPTRITARLDHGVLNIEVPKTDKAGQDHHEVQVE